LGSHAKFFLPRGAVRHIVGALTRSSRARLLAEMGCGVLSVVATVGVPTRCERRESIRLPHCATTELAFGVPADSGLTRRRVTLSVE
jgi:hypothetical protein